MDEQALLQRLQRAIDAGRKAGALTLEHFRRSDLRVDRKRDGTPVTVADRDAEQLLRAEIIDAFADDAILGEELPDREGSTGFQWVLDPVDGTKSFIHGVPLYGTLVGVRFQGQCVIGVLLLPGLDEYLYAARGHGAWHVRGNAEPARARVSSVQALGDATFCTTSVNEFMITKRWEAYDQLRQACQLGRYWGDCFGYALVATGRIEVMIEPQLSPWDMAALPPILEEAGGTFTDWQGRPTIETGEGLATNGVLLEAVLGITRGRS